VCFVLAGQFRGSLSTLLLCKPVNKLSCLFLRLLPFQTLFSGPKGLGRVGRKGSLQRRGLCSEGILLSRCAA
jgi:hypothetical protein